MRILLRKNLRGLSLVLVILVFWLRGSFFLDPDFGWHLKMGQLITTSGIPKTDPFSYTMPSFPFIDHEWLTNVLIAFLFPGLGRLGLALVYALVGAWALKFCFRARNGLFKKTFSEFKFLESGLLLLAANAVFPFVGIRPQLESWLLFSFLLGIFLNQRLRKKFLVFLPLFLVLWTNLHGSFALGIATVWLFWILELVEKREFPTRLFFLVIFSTLATLVNPYTFRIWKEIWQQMSDRSLRTTIAEWQPGILFFNFPFWILAAFSLLLISRYRNKFNSSILVVYFVLLAQSLLTIRHTPLWVLLAIPVIFEGMGYFYREAREYKFGLKRLRKAFFFWYLGSLILFFLGVGLSLFGPNFLGRESFYPWAAVDYLKQNLQDGEIFSKYDWGGFLIWQLPEKKVFIDGRMPSWRWQADLPGESNYAMREYLGIVTGRLSYEAIFDEYQIKTVLFPPSLSSRPKQGFFLRVVKLFVSERELGFLDQLLAGDWEISYQDSSAVILERL